MLQVGMQGLSKERIAYLRRKHGKIKRKKRGHK